MRVKTRPAVTFAVTLTQVSNRKHCPDRQETPDWLRNLLALPNRLLCDFSLSIGRACVGQKTEESR
jgi:hypothetical protein